MATADRFAGIFRPGIDALPKSVYETKTQHDLYIGASVGALALVDTAGWANGLRMEFVKGVPHDIFPGASTLDEAAAGLELVTFTLNGSTLAQLSEVRQAIAIGHRKQIQAVFVELGLGAPPEIGAQQYYANAGTFYLPPANEQQPNGSLAAAITDLRLRFAI